MRKTFLVLIMILVLSGTAFASDTDISVTDTSKALAISKQGQDQSQGQQQGQNQGQQQGQSQTFTPTNKQGQGQGQMNDWSQIYYTAPNYLQPQPIYPYLLQMVPGVVGRMPEDSVPEFADIERLKMKRINPNTGEVIQAGDKVIKTIYYTRGGRLFGFSRLEDYDSDVIALIPEAKRIFNQSDTSAIRFDTLFKMDSKSIGANGGGGGGTAGFTNTTNPVAWVLNGTGIGAFAKNTANPIIIIKFYLIKLPDPQLKKMSEIEYKEQGWTKVDTR